MVLGLELSWNADCERAGDRIGRDKISGVKRSRRQPPEEPPWQAAAVVEHDACSGDRAVQKHSIHIARRTPATMQAWRNKKARGKPALFVTSLCGAKLLADGGGLG